MEGGVNIFVNEKHPLLNDVVLNVLFEHLKVEELKKCRTVCPVWNSSVLTSRSWKRRAKVRFGNKGDLTVENFLTLLVENRIGSCVSEIFEIYESDMHLMDIQMYKKISYFCIPQPFWSRCGAWIKILKLQEVKFESVDAFRRVIYEACPNMEQLILHYIEVTRSENEGDDLALETTNYLQPQFGEHKIMRVLSIKQFWKSYGVSWMELLSHFPNLKVRTLSGQALRSDWSIPNIAGLLTSFIKIREAFPNKLKLKHITCISPPPEFFRILKDPDLQLQTIEADVFPDADELREILAIHASSLKKLCLVGNDEVQEHYPLKIFPLQSTKFRSIGLDALQFLELNNNVLDSLTLLKLTPNLTTLIIGECCDDAVIANSQWSEMRDVSLKKCTRLCLEFFLSLESLSKLINWMPNVEKLMLLETGSKTNAHFQMICEGWPGLVSLVGVGTVDDVGITGLDEDDVRRINEQEENSSWRPITVPRANITALKGLRKLYMSGAETMTEIGYCAAVCGVEQLPKLERLHFDEYESTARIWDSLHSRFPKYDPDLINLDEYTALWDFRLS